MTKNLTLAVPENLLEEFRLLAAQKKSSVNALLRKHMEESVGLESRRKAAIARMLELGQQTTARFDMSTFDRDASYQRSRQD